MVGAIQLKMKKGSPSPCMEIYHTKQPTHSCNQDSVKFVWYIQELKGIMIFVHTENICLHKARAHNIKKECPIANILYEIIVSSDDAILRSTQEVLIQTLMTF